LADGLVLFVVSPAFSKNAGLQQVKREVHE
jgi:hypothetical protein